MGDFRISEAAFAGYGLIKRKPGLWLALFIFCLVINYVGYGMIGTTAGPVMAQIRDAGGTPDPGMAMQVVAATGQLLLIAGVMAALSYMISAGAVARAVVRPSTSKPPYIGLGVDELRLLVVGLVVGLILFALQFAGTILVGLASVGVAVATGEMAQLAENPGQQPAAMRTTTIIGSIIIYVLTFLLSVRFSLAPAQSEREEGVRIFGSWALTKGRYWKTTGAYALALLSLVPFYIAASAAIIGVFIAMGQTTEQAIQSLSMPDWSGLSLFSPVVLTYVVLNSAVLALAWVVLLASSATVYAKVAGTVGDVFSDDDDEDDDED